MTDSERIDALEAEMKEEPFVMHNLVCELKGPYRGLGLIGSQRTLREAIDSMCRFKVHKKETSTK